jgi:hypothetical protein
MSTQCTKATDKIANIYINRIFCSALMYGGHSFTNSDRFTYSTVLLYVVYL